MPKALTQGHIPFFKKKRKGLIGRKISSLCKLSNRWWLPLDSRMWLLRTCAPFPASAQLAKPLSLPMTVNPVLCVSTSTAAKAPKTTCLSHLAPLPTRWRSVPLSRVQKGSPSLVLWIMLCLRLHVTIHLLSKEDCRRKHQGSSKREGGVRQKVAPASSGAQRNLCGFLIFLAINFSPVQYIHTVQVSLMLLLKVWFLHLQKAKCANLDLEALVYTLGWRQAMALILKNIVWLDHHHRCCLWTEWDNLLLCSSSSLPHNL